MTGDQGLSKINLVQVDRARAILHSVNSGPSFGGNSELVVTGGTTQNSPAPVYFKVMATSDPSHLYHYGYSHSTYYSPTMNPNNGWVHPAAANSVIPAEVELFKVVRDGSNMAKMWNAEPFAEAAGDDLDNALAEGVLKSMRNQEGALVEALEALHKAQAAFEDELTFVKPFVDADEDIVRLNIMGSLVDVSLSVLRLHEESMLATLFDTASESG